MHIVKLISQYDNAINYKEITIHLKDINLEKIVFKFEKRHFKHLLGFHYTKFRNTASAQIFKMCKNGKFELMENDLFVYDKKSNSYKRLSGKGVNKLIDKIKNFKIIHSILCSNNKTTLIDFDKTLIINGNTNQGSEYILHLEKSDTRFHLGLKYDSQNNIFVPISFFFESGDKKDKFIEGQRKIKIIKISRNNWFVAKKI